MSQQDLEIVQRFEDSWTRRDLDAALECVHTDFEFDWSESMSPIVGTRATTGSRGFGRTCWKHGETSAPRSWRSLTVVLTD